MEQNEGKEQKRKHRQEKERKKAQTRKKIATKAGRSGRHRELKASRESVLKLKVSKGEYNGRI